MTNFQSRLKQALSIKGMKQTDLAALMETGRSTVSQWINGRNGTSSGTAYQIAKKLNIDPAWLIGADVPYASFSESENTDNTSNEIISKLPQLSETEQRMVLGYIDGIITNHK